MARDSVNTMYGVQVLAECKLEERERSLTIKETPVNSSCPTSPKERIDKRTYREMIVEYARKNTQMRYQRSPYAAMTLSLFDTQFWYQR